MTDREVLRAAARDIRTMMRRRQAEDSQTIEAWAPPRPDLLALAVECDDVVYGLRSEAQDLSDRLVGVLGDDWEP